MTQHDDNPDDNPNEELLEQAIAALRDAPALGELPFHPLLRSIDAASRDAATHNQPHWIFNRIRTMKSISKIAASILLAIGLAAIGWAVLLRGAPALAFADVAQQLHDAQTITADLVIKQPQLTMKGKIMYLAPGHARVEMAGAPPEIVDQQSGRIILRDDDHKSVLVMQIDPKGQNGNAAASVDWIEALRSLSRNAGQPVAETEIEGVPAQQFKLQQASGQQMSIFADAKTGVPLRIENTGTFGGVLVTMTLEHITLGQPLAASMFSTDVPAGYSQQQTTASAEPISENDLVKFLRDYADANGGVFAPSLKDFRKDTGIGAHTLVRPGAGASPPTSLLPSPAFMDAVMTATRALLFISQLPPTADWRYAGAGLKKGDGSKPIFWYRPTPDATTVRVIYDDLHTADIPLTNAPQDPNAERQ